MRASRGEIVLAQITFSDQTGSKKRPVVIVSSDQNNLMIDDVIVATISSRTRSGSMTHVIVDPNQPDGNGSGLLHPSFVQCENIFTLDNALITRRMGKLSSTIQQEVDRCLRIALDLR